MLHLNLSACSLSIVSLFSIKQGELQKRNPFDQVTTVKYGLEALDTITLDNVLESDKQVDHTFEATRTTNARSNP